MRRDVLLLQGPIGPFFSRFAEDLEERGFAVHKVNLNGGDKLFYRRPGAIDYTGTVDEWSDFIERLIVNRKIGRIYLFGDCRVYHRIAREVAARNQVRVFVFEEGYIRPNFVTLEESGVNGNSTMMRKDFAIEKPPGDAGPELSHPQRVFALTGLYSIIYYWASALRSSRFSGYQHHRDFRPIPEGWRWVASGLRKLRYRFRDRDSLSGLLAQFEYNYFVCPLQVHCDMQVVVHSDYNSIEHFIGDVLTSFAKHAPKNKAIVFKHHPMDRAYTDYTNLLNNLASELGVQGRVFYMHDVCLPTLLKNAQGTVLINSTVGMSSLFHGTPVKTLGKAIYDLPGLTSQSTLRTFWRMHECVDTELFQAFRAYLVSRNQINGNLYRLLSDTSPSGFVWSAALDAEHVYEESRIELAEQPRLKPVTGIHMKPQLPAQDDDAAAA